MINELQNVYPRSHWRRHGYFKTNTMPRKSKYEGGSIIYPVRIPKKEPEQSQAKKEIKETLKKYETNPDTPTGAHQ